jgi:hypothetical protein
MKTRKAKAMLQPDPATLDGRVPKAIPARPAMVAASKQVIFGGLTITPRGFLAAEGVFRSGTSLPT